MKKTIVVLCCALLLVLCLPTDNFKAQTQDVVLVGAGDIARCGPENLFYPQATATLLDSIPGSVFAIGDLAYVDGLETEFNRCFDATWGRHRARLHPVPGVHDLIAPNGFGYFNYFGPAAGDPTKGYYSFNYGAARGAMASSRSGRQPDCVHSSPLAYPALHFHKCRRSSGRTAVLADSLQCGRGLSG